MLSWSQPYSVALPTRNIMSLTLLCSFSSLNSLSELHGQLHLKKLLHSTAFRYLSGSPQASQTRRPPLSIRTHSPHSTLPRPPSFQVWYGQLVQLHASTGLEHPSQCHPCSHLPTTELLAPLLSTPSSPVHCHTALTPLALTANFQLFPSSLRLLPHCKSAFYLHPKWSSKCADLSMPLLCLQSLDGSPVSSGKKSLRVEYSYSYLEFLTHSPLHPGHPP